MNNQFQRFMMQMKGQDPNKIINQMIQSGKLSQAQLDQVQQQAKIMEKQFESFKSMFGFK